MSNVHVDLCSGLNVFVGPNGSGKTALLEAVHVLARGRSFRTPGISSVIQHDQKSLVVRGVMSDEIRGRQTVGISKFLNGQTELRVNNNVEKRLSNVAIMFPVQLLLPDAAELLFSGPSVRRRFLDWGVFHVEHSYLPTLRAFQKALKQRNALLRKLSIGSSSSQLDLWDAKLSELSLSVTSFRETYLGKLEAPFQNALSSLDRELLINIGYNKGWKAGLECIDALKESSARDIATGATHCGPHRAEMEIVTDKGYLASKVLSRGQAKTVAHALNFAQASLSEDVAGRKSLFLIDDVGAELDGDHGISFFRLLSSLGCQVIATATTEPVLEGSYTGEKIKTFHVKQGACIEAIGYKKKY
ncbi:MAG: DNA replication/repair protein RecF [Pseudomonadales bacterium]|nr:DNA replication/repair protein RecF [Pseudomonadales bacterium]